MTCADVRDRDLLDRYVQGTLPDDERDALEIHVLGCAECAGELETALDLRQALLQEPRTSRPVIPWWAAAAAAVVLVAALATWWSLRRDAGPPPVSAEAPALTPAPPAPSLREEALAELAQIAPPAYEETVLRGGDRRAFQTAMRAYLEGRYQEAIRGLRAAVMQDPTAREAWFYLGASHLLLGETEPAIEALHRVVDDPNPFAEEARFYLVKALIGAGRLEEAREQLDRLAASPGPWAADAKDLLRRLDAIR